MIVVLLSKTLVKRIFQLNPLKQIQLSPESLYSTWTQFNIQEQMMISQIRKAFHDSRISLSSYALDLMHLILSRMFLRLGGDIEESRLVSR